MGQPIVVVEKPSVANPGMVRFETNRALTGMGHERYVAGAEVRGDRPPDELARRLLAFDSVDAVHVNGSIVTVDLAKGMTSEGLKGVIEGLYIHYPPTADAVEEAPSPEAAAEATEADTGAPASEGEVVEAEAAAPAESAPAPEHPEPVPAAEAAADADAGTDADAATADTADTDAATPGPDEAAEAPAASSSPDVADPGEETEADVERAEGDAPTQDQVPVGGTPSDPPADDPTAAPSPSADEA